MIRRIFNPFFTHLRIRARACLRSPGAWIIFLVFGLTTVVYWPNTPGASNPLEDPNEGLPLLLTWFLWFWLWLAPPMIWVRGRATAGKGEAPLGIGPAPALPVGPRIRAVAEAFLALTILGAIRWAALSVYQGSWSLGFALETVVGASFLFPMAVVWALPVRNPGTFMVRPISIAILAAWLHQAGGFFDTGLGMISGGLALTAVALLITNLELPEINRKSSRRGAAFRMRKWKEPQVQLAQDAWRYPLLAWAPWVVAAVLIFGSCMLLDIRGISWEWILFAGFEVFLIVALQPLFRPFNSNLLAESLVGKHQVSRGDFMKAWNVLPVGRESVLRMVWIHGAVIGLFLWVVPVAVLIGRHRLVEGQWSLAGGIGDLSQFVVVGGLFVPVMAGLLVAVAVGRKLEYALSGLSLLLGVHVLFLVKVVLQEWFGRGSTPAEVGPIVTLIVLIVVGSVPPLRYLRRAPEPV